MCINKIFNNRIELKINKRLDNEEDKQRLYNLTNDIFDENKNQNMIELLRSYNIKIINRMDQLKTIKNISYFNHIANKVNKHVQNNIIKTPKNYIEYANYKWYKDLKIVCKKHNVIGLNNKTKNDKDISKYIIHNL